MAIAVLAAALSPVPALAQIEAPRDSERLQEEDDFRETPYTEYGDFNASEDEAADARFFQYGRFFGVSLGIGVHGATGNRGLLWQGGFPLVNVKVHAWFDFNVGLQMGLHTGNHTYDRNNKGSIVDVSLFSLDLFLKYYIPTQDTTAAISFANPYLTGGIMGLTRTETDPTVDGAITPYRTVGFGAGAGLEFAVVPKKTYLSLEGVLYLAPFEDRFRPDFRSSHGIEDLSGAFYMMTANVLITW